MAKLGFDDPDYSVVVKNRGEPSEVVEVGDFFEFSARAGQFRLTPTIVTELQRLRKRLVSPLKKMTECIWRRQTDGDHANVAVIATPLSTQAAIAVPT